jgi:cobalt-zinc-cadmium efflux system membrane fusion protein
MRLAPSPTGADAVRTLLLSTAAVWLLALVSGCSHDAAADREPPAHVVEAPDPSVVAVEHGEQVARAKATERLLPNELRVTGVVVPDVARTVHVTSLGAGRLLELRVRLGDQVEKGQLLLTIRSPDLTAAIADYRKALADQRLSERALRRARDLFRNRALALKDLQQAENDAEKDAIDVEAARERIVLLGGDPDGLSPVIEVRAPIAGTIVEQNVAHGEAVKSLDSSSALLTLADLSRVWVLCDVYENNLADVHEGDRAEVRLNAYPDVPLAGTVGDIARVLDPATRTAKVRIELDNAQGLLRPGMFATARFESQVVTPHVVAPASAVLRLQDRSWVFRVEGPGRFRRTEVQAGRVLPDGAQEILAGLAPGDEVALDALALVGTASRT